MMIQERCPPHHCPIFISFRKMRSLGKSYKARINKTCYLWLYRQDQEGQANTVSGRGVQMCHAKDDTVLLHVNTNCKAAADIVQVNIQAHYNLFFLFEPIICEASFQGRTLCLRESQIPSYSVRLPWPNLSCCCWGWGGRRANFWAGINFYSKHTITSHSKWISSFPKLNLPGYVLKSCFLLCPETLWCIINIKPQEAVLLLILGN